MSAASDASVPASPPAVAGGEVCCEGTSETCATPQTPQQHIAAHVLDGCPKPIGWQEVVTTFREQAQAWEIQRDGRTIKGWTWGTGRPLYLLNGMGGDAEILSLLIYLLRDLYRCVVFDYPGNHGESVRFSKIPLDTIVDDLLAVADHHGDETFALFGTSFGSLVTLRTLTRFPDRVDKATIQGGFAYRKLSWPERSLARLGTFLPGRLHWLPGRRFVQKMNHKHWFPLIDPTRWDWYLENAGQVPLRALAHRGCLIGQTDLRASLPTIQTPVLLIHCEGDGLVSNVCLEDLAQGLPHSHVEWFHSAGHLPFLTHPHRLGKLLRQFLEGELPAPPPPTSVPAEAPSLTSATGPTP